jgi:hypothetical protein
MIFFSRIAAGTVAGIVVYLAGVAAGTVAGIVVYLAGIVAGTVAGIVAVDMVQMPLINYIYLLL